NKLPRMLWHRRAERAQAGRKVFAGLHGFPRFAEFFVLPLPVSGLAADYCALEAIMALSARQV
ncbi:MAG: hypothetical protein ACKO8L_15320, partial [Flavobacterium sp.]